MMIQTWCSKRSFSWIAAPIVFALMAISSPAVAQPQEPRITAPTANSRLDAVATVNIAGLASAANFVEGSVVPTYVLEGSPYRVSGQGNHYRVRADNGGNWKATVRLQALRPEWKQVRYKITATQVSQHDSAQRSRTVSIEVLPQIQIISSGNPQIDFVLPPKIESPVAKERVSNPVVVRGEGIKGYRVQVTIVAKWTMPPIKRPTGRPLHARPGKKEFGPVTANVDHKGEWRTTPVKIEVPEKAKDVSYEISAVQVDPRGKTSAVRTVTALPMFQVMTLKPPVAQVMMRPTLTVTSPKPDEKIGSSLVVTGKASTGYTVRVYIMGIVRRDGTIRQLHYTRSEIPVKADGTWTTDAIDVSVKDKKAKVTYDIDVKLEGPGGKMLSFDVSQSLKVSRK